MIVSRNLINPNVDVCKLKQSIRLSEMNIQWYFVLIYSWKWREWKSFWKEWVVFSVSCIAYRTDRSNSIINVEISSKKRKYKYNIEYHCHIEVHENEIHLNRIWNSIRIDNFKYYSTLKECNNFNHLTFPVCLL